MNLIILLITHLPELLRIIELMDKRAKEASTQRNVKADLQTIEDAFKENDAEKLRNLFNS